MTSIKQNQGYGFGTFKGVFTPSILTIIGVIMYLRFGWVLGNVGLLGTLVIVTASSAITLLTGLSISALATNMRVKGGGAYYMLSRSFGLESGTAIGVPLALAQAIGASFYAAGFAEAFVNSGLPFVSGWDPRVVGIATLAAIALLSSFSADITLKAQYVIMAAIGISLVSFFMGGAPDAAVMQAPDTVPESKGFWIVLAVFFPAVTGILMGVGMSGDLKDPSRSLPVGTLAAVITGYIVYMTVPLVLYHFVSDPSILKTDTMILQKCARWQTPVMLGIWAATLSSAIGSLLAAPRVIQALANDRALPRFMGRGYGANNDPRFATCLTFAIAGVGVWLGDINAIAPVLTMFNLTTYGLLNLSAALEEMMGNPSWRPTFRVKSFFSFVGFMGCLAMMFMISPGWTFMALACEILVYWLMKRRAIRARWGDMRMGLFMFGARVAVRKLSKQRFRDGHNWRPILLVFAGVPTKRWHLIEMAGAISQNKSIMAIASVIPEDAWTAERSESLRETTGRYLEERGIEAQICIHSGITAWDGMKELVRTYGWGPLVPNTILLGPPSRTEPAVRFGELMKLMVSRKRNVIIVADNDNEDEGKPSKKRTIDIWWRGKQSNAPFMLAMACLVMRSDEWRGARLRVCHLLENGDNEIDSRQLLEGFLAEARVSAEPVVVSSFGTASPLERISETSRTADMVLLGLRHPNSEESAEDYGNYIRNYKMATSTLPITVFALAVENVDFNAIFE